MNLANRVKQQTTTVGAGPLTMGGVAPDGYQTCGAAFPSGAVDVPYICTMLPDWEVGYGTYNFGANTFTRTRVHASSNANNAVAFGAGTKTLVLGPSAECLAALQHKSNVALAAPGVNDDVTEGYNGGSLWVEWGDNGVAPYDARLWVCCNPANGAAVWKLTRAASAAQTRLWADAVDTYITTADATPTDLGLLNDAPGAYTNETLTHYTAFVYAFEPATGDSKAWRVDVMRQQCGAISAGIVANAAITAISAAAGAAAWSLAGAYAAGLHLTATGEVAKTIKWAVKIVHAARIELGV